jgi:hypothetical protein
MRKRTAYSAHLGNFAVHVGENSNGNVSLLWSYAGDPREHEIVLHNKDGHAVVATDMKLGAELPGTDRGRRLKRFWFSL